MCKYLTTSIHIHTDPCLFSFIAFQSVLYFPFQHSLTHHLHSTTPAKPSQDSWQGADALLVHTNNAPVYASTLLLASTRCLVGFWLRYWNSWNSLICLCLTNMKPCDLHNFQWGAAYTYMILIMDGWALVVTFSKLGFYAYIYVRFVHASNDLIYAL